MKSVLLLVLQLFSWTGGSPCCTWFRPPDGPVDRVQDRDQDWDQLQDQVQDLALELDGSAVLHRLDPRYLSVTVDASLAAQEKFMLLLRSEKIRTLARALSPAFLRFGGTRQDFMVFTPEKELQLDPDVSGGLAGPCVSCPGPCVDARLPWWWEERLKADWTRQQQVLVREDLQRKYRRIGFSELTVDMLHSFSSCSGLDLIFGLNALLRTADNSWNSSNADMLLRYCQARRYRLDWELGNEPNSFEKKAGIRVDGYQLGLDFTHLRKMMSESELYRDAGLYGPDVGQPRDHRADILEGFLQSGADAVDALTWHHYYVNGRDTSLEDFLDPEVLDTLALKTNEVMERVKEASPGKAVWLGETSSAYGGGALGLSDTFVAGFMWMDKLGLAARLGLGVVMRQVLLGSGSYHLVDENLDPLPLRRRSRGVVGHEHEQEAGKDLRSRPGVQQHSGRFCPAVGAARGGGTAVQVCATERTTAEDGG
ncbi:heparanase isoform X3 [Cololabis saira]|uniref:heparanase isoform X3 n=1 Tax=Cololabis saira TaxID=129043 RepID=UPI002AD37027|nr:heparanase isoform X3 [Cololabis saira]